MTFEYSEEMIQQIKSTGMTVEEFDEMISKGIQWLKEAFEEMIAIISHGITIKHC